MKISLGSWAFSFGPYADDPIPIDKTVERLARAGYDGIEICGFPPQVSLSRYPTAQSRSELRRFLEDHGLGVSGYAADFTGVNPVAAWNKPRYLELFRRNIEMCVDIGSPSVRVDSVAAPGSIDDRQYKASFERLADVWQDAAGIAQESRVRVVWEFEPGFVFNKPSEVLALHRQVAHPNFRILLDTAHAFMCGVVGARQHPPMETLAGGMPEFLKKLEGCIGSIHVNDSDGTLHGDDTSTHRPFGEGFIDFKALTPLLLQIPEIEWWCIDLSFWMHSWELIEPSREFVLDLLHAKAVRI